ncbi:MAG: chorismate-binding protein [Bacteroidia bacterium]|nr:chorismate-binding protein [Bacteroidia bacterium]
MKKIHLFTHHRRLLADTVTPVSLYLRLRDHFAGAMLLESSDYHGNENTYSFICLSPMSRFSVQDGVITRQYPDDTQEQESITQPGLLPDRLQAYVRSFETEALPLRFSYNGLFGYQTYDTVQYYDTVQIRPCEDENRRIPDMVYQLYRYLIVINHFNNEMHLLEHTLSATADSSGLDRLEALIRHQSLPQYRFACEGPETSNMDDAAYLAQVRQGIAHCARGDVFQIVLSRRFSQAFSGDEFNVYRALRSVNPSPYLFYCDYGDFKLMGSSPEAQLVIQGGKASIYPIAGTFRRTGHDDEDARLARMLFEDPKENAEHVMLVDLARNDLSRSGTEVKVETFKEIQYYSHVIHLVSRVTAAVDAQVSSLQLAADTFPAGTLSGAPKHMAMQLINRIEPDNRGYYGGCIGYLGFDGSFNHAIMIRSFLSKGNRLFFQAGAGVVFKSEPEKELQEVSNKLMALRRALELAATL